MCNPARFAQSITQNELDLRIQTAQIVIGPAVHCRERFLVDAQRERFACAHRSTVIESGVKRPGIDNRLGALLAA